MKFSKLSPEPLSVFPVLSDILWPLVLTFKLKLILKSKEVEDPDWSSLQLSRVTPVSGAWHAS